MARPGNADRAAARPAALLTGRRGLVTGRGAVLIMAGVFLIGLLASALLGWAVPGGLAFVLGCVLAARCTRPADLLTAAVSPPLVLAGVLPFVTLATGSGGLFLSVVVGSVVTLAGIAPWLAGGMVLTLAIAWARGLPRCVQDLRRALRPDPGGPGKMAR
jgi:hypothetical protein